jgi:hypothetical protein
MIIAMRLVKAALEIRFEGYSPLFEHKRKIIDALGIEDIPTEPNILESVDIKVSQQFAHIVVEGKRILIITEQTTPRLSREFITGVLNKLERPYGLTNLTAQQLGYRCFFIHESEETFRDMVTQFKTSLFSSAALYEDAVDVGLPLTFNIDERRVNFQSGPMKPAQLKTFLEYPITGLQRSFVVDIDFIKNDLRVSADIVGRFIASVQVRQNELIRKWEEAVIYE